MLIFLLTFVVSFHAIHSISLPPLSSNIRAKIGEFPYHVSIQYDARHICSGALITRRHVLTSGRCLHHFVTTKAPKSRINVVIGAVSIDGGISVGVDRISRHPEFDESMLHADVGVIRLSTLVPLTSTIQPIQLPLPFQELSEDLRFVVTSFGPNFNQEVSPLVLNGMSMYETSRNKCQRYWDLGPVDSSHMCVTNVIGDGFCQGDIGSSVTVEKQIVVGIISAVYSKGCARGNPDFVTKVSYYTDYIYSEINAPDWDNGFFLSRKK